jgi:hypothetical protein
MTIKQSSPRKKLIGFTWLLVVIAVLGLFLAAGGFIFAASNETHDPFCASCHTQPESTFFQRSTDAQAVDLASYHTTQKPAASTAIPGRGLSGVCRQNCWVLIMRWPGTPIPPFNRQNRQSPSGMPTV